MRFCAFAVVLTLWLSGCADLGIVSVSAQKMELHEDESAMREEVLRHTPIGMSIDDAKVIMALHGFKCQTDRSLPPKIQSPSESAQAVIYARSWPVPFWSSFFMSFVMEVVIFYEDGKVREVACHYDSCCL